MDGNESQSMSVNISKRKSKLVENNEKQLIR